MAEIGNSNLSVSRFSQAKENRASRDTWRASKDRVDNARDSINSLRESLINPNGNTSPEPAQTNSETQSALDRFLEEMEQEFGHLEFENFENLISDTNKRSEIKNTTIGKAFRKEFSGIVDTPKARLFASNDPTQWTVYDEGGNIIPPGHQNYTLNF